MDFSTEVQSSKYALEEKLLDNKITFTEYLTLEPQCAQMLGFLLMARYANGLQNSYAKLEAYINDQLQDNLTHYRTHLSNIRGSARATVREQLAQNIHSDVIEIIKPLYDKLKQLIKEGRAQILPDNV